MEKFDDIENNIKDDKDDFNPRPDKNIEWETYKLLFDWIDLVKNNPKLSILIFIWFWLTLYKFTQYPDIKFLSCDREYLKKLFSWWYTIIDPTKWLDIYLELLFVIIILGLILKYIKKKYGKK